MTDLRSSRAPGYQPPTDDDETPTWTEGEELIDEAKETVWGHQTKSHQLTNDAPVVAKDLLDDPETKVVRYEFEQKAGVHAGGPAPFISIGHTPKKLPKDLEVDGEMGEYLVYIHGFGPDLSSDGYLHDNGEFADHAITNESTLGGLHVKRIDVSTDDKPKPKKKPKKKSSTKKKKSS